MTLTKKLKVGVLFGGISGEREVSLATGRYVYSLVDTTKFEPIALYMAQDRRIYKLPMKLVLMNKTVDIEAGLGEAEFIPYNELNKHVDIVFNALLGKFGEDGRIQGMLEILKIPYTGSGVLTSALLMNKKMTKLLLKKFADSKQIYLAKDLYITKKQWETSKEDTLKEIESTLGFPVVVKPIAEGSSLGVSFVKTSKEIQNAVEEAFKLDQEILIEEYIDGIEFMCVVIGNDNPVAMLPSEAEYTGKIFTYDEKYLPGKARYFTPPRNVSKELVEELRKIAETLYKEFNIKGYGRVDGFIVQDKIYISELHTGTIMVPASYVFQQGALSKDVSESLGVDNIKGADLNTAKNTIKGKGFKGKGVNSGLSPKELVSTIIYLALDAHKNKTGPL